MSKLHASLLITMAALAACVATVRAETLSPAAELFAQGKAMLASGDFDAALKAFAAAAKKDSENQAYRDQYALVRRVGKMRETVAKEQNPEKWQETALALRAFYYDNALYTQALPLDVQINERVKTPVSAGLLARTQIELGQNADAAKVLQTIPQDARTPESQAMLGLALARSGDLAQAKTIAAQLTLPEQTGPDAYYDVARLNALLGMPKESAAALTHCFEFTPPSRLEAMKAEAKASKELETVLASADSAKVLETASKVKESGCSGGSNCGTCKSKGTCSKSGASHPAEGEKKP